MLHPSVACVPEILKDDGPWASQGVPEVHAGHVARASPL
jgi:hypothetical protein